MATVLHHRIQIACQPDTLFDYVSQPWRWHEWHPSSRSAHAKVDRLQVGDAFDERIAVQPLSPIPLTLIRATHYRVIASERGRHWEVRGTMKDGWLMIHYDFAATAEGTCFDRTLTYETHGLSRLLMPLLQPRMEATSRLALDRLKQRMEATARIVA